jgi:predicted nucleic acid-binding protein
MTRAAIADSGFVIALVNRRDPDHAGVAMVARQLQLPPWLPSPAATEICYVLQSRLGSRAVGHFLRLLGDGSAGLALLEPEPVDYARSAEVLDRYAGAGVDFVDALLVAAAERLDIRTVLTLDRRHMGVIRPAHCASFELLPEEASPSGGGRV